MTNRGSNPRSAQTTMSTQNGRAFNDWLRTQLKAKKMSQRQLAQQSGVDHSTISRLIRGDRMPSLGTATKLARGLRELRDDADTTQYLGLVGTGSTNPTARVEYALRADELLSEAQVRQIMEYYLAVRMRRYGRSIQPTENTKSSGSDRSSDRSLTRPASETSAAPGGLRNGTATINSVRPVVRSLREPGRY
jgi:transcriptional regulator with XRE-family HTH domain